MARLGAQVTGIDAAGAQHRRRRACMPRARSSRSTIAQTTAEALAETGAQFDIVLALEIVEHVADVDLFLNSVRPAGQAGRPGVPVDAQPHRQGLGARHRRRRIRAALAAARHARLAQVPEAVGSRCAACAHGGVEAQEIVGVVYSPLSRAWSLNKRDLDVNYMLYGSEPAA